MFWLVRAGASWRIIPQDLPLWRMIYQQTQRWIKAGVFDLVGDIGDQVGEGGLILLQQLSLFAQPDGNLVQIVLQQAEAALAVVAYIQGIIARIDAAQVGRKPRYLRGDGAPISCQQQGEPTAGQPDQRQTGRQQARQQTGGNAGIRCTPIVQAIFPVYIIPVGYLWLKLPLRSSQYH